MNIETTRDYPMFLLSNLHCTYIYDYPNIFLELALALALVLPNGQVSNSTVT